jgi:SAM-dependent methyltransferase
MMIQSTTVKKASMSDRASTWKYYKKDFWATENLKYSKPNLRLEKAAQIINKMAGSKRISLLDVGCGPATLASLLDHNIEYYGLDVAITHPAPNLIEADFIENPIVFGDKRFDMVVALGVFEYMGDLQSQKLSDMAGLLNEGGTLVASYKNFGHRRPVNYWPYNNVQPISSFRSDLERFFSVRRTVPSSLTWSGNEPTSRPLKALNMRLNLDVPLVGALLTTEYFFICSARIADSDSPSRVPRRTTDRSWLHSFADGVGATFDIAGVIRPTVTPSPPFEASISEDVHALYVQLGLDSQDTDPDTRRAES